MTFIEVVDAATAKPDDRLLGSSIDLPRPGFRLEGSRFDVAGWALGRGGRLIRTDCLVNGELATRPHRMIRTDLANAFGDVRGAHRAGFLAEIEMPATAAAEVELRAVVERGSRVTLGTVLVRRSWRVSADPTISRLVSIVIPAADRDDLVCATVESALTQSYPNVEIVVVDDGPVDRSVDRSRYDHVRWITADAPGIRAAWNTGLRRTNGDYLVLVGAGETLLPDALGEAIRVFEAQPAAGCVVGAHEPATSRATPSAAVAYRRALLDAIGPFGSAHLSVDENLDRIAREYPVHAHSALVAKRGPSGDVTSAATATSAQPGRRVTQPSRGRPATHQARSRERGSEHATRPLVSVVIPCYQQGHFLAEAIESAIDQPAVDAEVIVIDDGSMDNTEAVTGRYPGVRYIRQPNRGLARARNRGLDAARGEFVVFLDADDRLLPGALATGARAFSEHPECVLVCGHSTISTEDGSPAPETFRPRLGDDPYRDILLGCPIIGPGTVMYRRSLFSSIPAFDPSISPAADYDLYYRVARAHSIYSHGAIVAVYRRHGGNMTSGSRTMLRANVTAIRRQRWFVIRRPRYWRAYRRGVRYWQSHQGNQVAQRVQRDLRQRRFGEAVRGLAALAAWSPWTLLVLIRARRTLVSIREWKPEG